MAYRIIFTEPASADIEDAYRYLRRRNPVAARSIVRGIYERSQILADHPESGSALGDDFDPQLPRNLVYRQWWIVYRRVPADELILILRVWHTARGPVELKDD